MTVQKYLAKVIFCVDLDFHVSAGSKIWLTYRVKLLWRHTIPIIMGWEAMWILNAPQNWSISFMDVQCAIVVIAGIPSFAGAYGT